MLKVLGVVVGVLILPALAFGQGDQGSGISPRGAVPPPQPASLAAPPRPTLAPTKKIDATYPDKAKRAGVQGDAWLDVIVLADGTVKSVMIAKSLDTVFGLDQAAIAAVRQWQYPPLTDGRATRPPVRIVIPFRLPGAPAAVSVATLEEFGKDAFLPVGRDPRVVLPKVKHQVTPVYTTAGLRAKIVGSVEVEAVVLPDGTVGQVRVVKSLDQPTGLDDQALGAAREWMFRARNARRKARADDRGHRAELQPPLGRPADPRRSYIPPYLAPSRERTRRSTIHFHAAVGLRPIPRAVDGRGGAIPFSAVSKGGMFGCRRVSY